MKKRLKVWLEQRTAEGRRDLEQRLDSGSASFSSSSCLSLSLGVWVVPEEYMVWSPSSTQFHTFSTRRWCSHVSHLKT